MKSCFSYSQHDLKKNSYFAKVSLPPHLRSPTTKIDVLLDPCPALAFTEVVFVREGSKLPCSLYSMSTPMLIPRDEPVFLLIQCFRSADALGVCRMRKRCSRREACEEACASNSLSSGQVKRRNKEGHSNSVDVGVLVLEHLISTLRFPVGGAEGLFGPNRRPCLFDHLWPW